MLCVLDVSGFVRKESLYGLCFVFGPFCVRVQLMVRSLSLSRCTFTVDPLPHQY